MQMYKGLPIITNKISVEEQRGVPHHLLGVIGLDEETWTVHAFKREASKIIKEIRSRGNLPIVVGGTHYYVNALLADDHLVDGPRDGGLEGDSSSLDLAQKFPILNASTEEMYAKLREVDPVIADRWLPNERRKIRRSLEIYFSTGRKASEIYLEQQQQRAAAAKDGTAGGRGPWESLIFVLQADRTALVDRLDKRIAKMLDRGLLDETAELYAYLRAEEAAGRSVDRSRGIWQSIGFKEFEPFLEATSTGTEDPAPTAELLEKLRAQGIERTQAATRQYAKRQASWLAHKTLPIVDEAGAMDRVFVLDSSDVGKWEEAVCAPAHAITDAFLSSCSAGGGGHARFPETLLSSPISDPAVAAAVAAAAAAGATAVGKRKTLASFTRRECSVCPGARVFVLDEMWERHVRGKAHRRNEKRLTTRGKSNENERVTPLASGDDAGGQEESYAGTDYDRLQPDATGAEQDTALLHDMTSVPEVGR